MDETTRVVNPEWRRLDGEIRRRLGLQDGRKVRLHDLRLKDPLDSKQAEHYMQQAEVLRAEIEEEAAALERLKAQRRALGKHITISELPEEEKFMKLATRSKHFIDTLKIIAYRAETAMARMIREHLGEHHQDEARAFVRDLYTTEANLIPDVESKTLTVEIHSLATPKANRILARLCAELTATATDYPDTDLRLIFKSVSE